MRTTSEIIEAIRDGEKPEYREIYMALCVLMNLQSFNTQDILAIHKTGTDKQKYIASQQFSRTQRAYQTDPEKYLGKEWNPETEEYKLQRAFNKALWNRIFGGDKE